ncbi:MAG: hypothetical protein LKJ94_07325 [Candidatus Methanomethylophilus sp.]|jgi:hypothetical protein|nr:hypothetical protein [Methanomethylophilus sp.]MCI2075482.1 hypothetical protein [Methanomethylophilus sp.]MCI2093304.1 hypothetical protein [Methanomethylophilus sp.]
MVSRFNNTKMKGAAFLAVLLMAAAAFGAVVYATDADDSDASTSTYTYSNVPETFTPYPGDIIKITGVSKCSTVSFASLSGTTVTITVPQSSDSDSSNPLVRIWNTSGNSKFIFLKMSEHFGASKLTSYHSDGSTAYVLNGATVSLASYHDIVEEDELDVEGYVMSVTPGYGLSVKDGNLSGTINAPAGTRIAVAWHQECNSGSEETGDFVFNIYVVGKSLGGVSFTSNNDYIAQRGSTITVAAPWNSNNRVTDGISIASIPSGFTASIASYSTITVTVGSNVPNGAYQIIIKNTIGDVVLNRTHTIWINDSITAPSEPTSNIVLADASADGSVNLTHVSSTGGEISKMSFVAGTVAPGVTVSYSGSNIVVSGTPTSGGTFVAEYSVTSVDETMEEDVQPVYVCLNVPVQLTISDQSVAAGGSVSISTGVPGITVTGQDWLHVSSDGRIYGTAPSAPGSYKATAQYGSQSDEFAITVVSALTFISTPSAGIFAYEG